MLFIATSALIKINCLPLKNLSSQISFYYTVGIGNNITYLYAHINLMLLLYRKTFRLLCIYRMCIIWNSYVPLKKMTVAVYLISYDKLFFTKRKRYTRDVDLLNFMFIVIVRLFDGESIWASFYSWPIRFNSRILPSSPRI